MEAQYSAENGVVLQVFGSMVLQVGSRQLMAN